MSFLTRYRILTHHVLFYNAGLALAAPVHMERTIMARNHPPFRADVVGSLLRPAAIKEARQQRQSGAIDAARLRQIEDREILRAVELQRQSGLRVVTDGEFRRAWWHFDFFEGLLGVESY